MDDEQVLRLYGTWRGNTVADASALLAGYPGAWWVAGGYAIEAFTGDERAHADLDLSIPRSDVPLLHSHLCDQIDLWQADRGALRPLRTGDVVTPTCDNLWLRRGGDSPWEYDVLLQSTTTATWTYKRDIRVTLPFSDILWERNDVRYLRPEIQLLHKAPGLRAKDQADFDACLPLLSQASTEWLAKSLTLAHPGHPWIAALSQHRGGRSQRR